MVMPGRIPTVPKPEIRVPGQTPFYKAPKTSCWLCGETDRPQEHICIDCQKLLDESDDQTASQNANELAELREALKSIRTECLTNRSTLFTNRRTLDRILNRANVALRIWP